MRAFAYERPSRLADALALLADQGPDARLLAGGTDLIIRIRDGSIQPRTVVDVKAIAELERGIREVDGWLRIGARTTMTDIVGDERIRRDYQALADGGRGRRVGPDPQPRDARRQHLQRLAGRRHCPGATRLRRPGRRRRSGRHPDRPARRVLRPFRRHDARAR